MEVGNNMRVDFHYVITECGKTLENSRKGSPMRYVHGHHAMLPGVEKALIGKRKGECLQVTLSPDEAYGKRMAGQQQRFSIKQLEHPAGIKNPKWRAGMVALLNTDQGQRQVTIIKPGRFTIECDTNHTFAGKTLDFALEVVDVRQATAQDLWTGSSKCCDDSSCCG